MFREDSDVRMLLVIYEVVWDVRSSAVLADPFLPMLSIEVSHGNARGTRKEEYIRHIHLHGTDRWGLPKYASGRTLDRLRGNLSQRS